jgi:hypothetical protein
MLKGVLMVIFALFLTTMLFNQYTYEDCKAYDMKPKACAFAKSVQKYEKK